jgi:hypothetical protein
MLAAFFLSLKNESLRNAGMAFSVFRGGSWGSAGTI